MILRYAAACPAVSHSWQTRGSTTTSFTTLTTTTAAGRIRSSTTSMKSKIETPRSGPTSGMASAGSSPPLFRQVPRPDGSITDVVSAVWCNFVLREEVANVVGFDRRGVERRLPLRSGCAARHSRWSGIGEGVIRCGHRHRSHRARGRSHWGTHFECSTPLAVSVGLLFLTTRNAAPFRKRLSSWRYVVPDVHVSFFEPTTLAVALEVAGFIMNFLDMGQDGTTSSGSRF